MFPKGRAPGGRRFGSGFICCKVGHRLVPSLAHFSSSPPVIVSRGCTFTDTHGGWVAGKSRRCFVCLQQPDTAVPVIPKQLRVLGRAQITRPNHVGAVNICAVVY